MPEDCGAALGSNFRSLTEAYAPGNLAASVIPVHLALSALAGSGAALTSVRTTDQTLSASRLDRHLLTSYASNYIDSIFLETNGIVGCR